MRYLYPTPESSLGSIAPGILAGGFVFVSGQVGMDSSGQLMGENDVAAQAKQALLNVQAVLAEAGAQLSDVVQATIYLVDLTQFGAFDAVWREVFGEHRPTRTTLSANLVWDKLLVEVQVIACIEANQAQ
jgi:2-iminobutanoate/2-iminopropanoate deaminase